MKSIDLFLPHIMPHVVGCPTPTAYAAIRTAAAEFCERSRLWRKTSVVAFVDGVAAYAPPADAVLFEVETAYTETTNEIVPKSVDWLDDNVSGWRTGTGTMAQYITQLNVNVIQTVPLITGNISLSVWLRTSEDADEVPDFLFDLYARTIKAGALSEIMAIPKQSFTDTGLASYWRSRFMNDLDGSMDKNITGQQRAATRTKGSYY